MSCMTHTYNFIRMTIVIVCLYKMMLALIYNYYTYYVHAELIDVIVL